MLKSDLIEQKSQQHGIWPYTNIPARLERVRSNHIHYTALLEFGLGRNMGLKGKLGSGMTIARYLGL